MFDDIDRRDKVKEEQLIRNNDRETRICFHCGNIGHLRRDCRMLAIGNSNRGNYNNIGNHNNGVNYNYRGNNSIRGNNYGKGNNNRGNYYNNNGRTNYNNFNGDYNNECNNYKNNNRGSYNRNPNMSYQPIDIENNVDLGLGDIFDHIFNLIDFSDTRPSLTLTVAGLSIKCLIDTGASCLIIR